MAAIKNGTLLVKDSNGNTARVATLSQTDITTLNTALTNINTNSVSIQSLTNQVKTIQGRYVDVDTQQDITGLKVFNRPIVGIICKEERMDVNVVPTSEIHNSIRWQDKYAHDMGMVKSTHETGNWHRMEMTAIAQDSSGNDIYGQLAVSIKPDGSIRTSCPQPPVNSNDHSIATTAWTRNYCEKKWQDIATEHNNIYRGANLLSGHFASISAVISAISKGDFSDIYVGDYIPASYTVDGEEKTANFRIAGINTLKARGGAWGTQSPNVCIVPDTLGSSSMNDTDTTAGGYVGSKMYTTVLPKYYNALAGSASCPFYGHILKTMERLTNAVDTNLTVSGFAGWKGAVNGVADYANQNLTLMSEIEVYGCKNWSSTARDDETMCVQLPLFKLKPEIITLNGSLWFWLRSVANSTRFCGSNIDLAADCFVAGYVSGVRPRFFIG